MLASTMLWYVKMTLPGFQHHGHRLPEPRAKTPSIVYKLPSLGYLVIVMENKARSEMHLLLKNFQG